MIPARPLRPRPDLWREPAPTLLTVNEVAARLRVSKMTIYRVIEQGDLAAIRIGRSLRVPEKALNKYLRDAGTEGGAA